MTVEQMLQGLLEWWWQYPQREGVAQLILAALQYHKAHLKAGWLNDFWDINSANAMTWALEKRIYRLSGLFQDEQMEGNADGLEDARAEAWHKFCSTVIEQFADQFNTPLKGSIEVRSLDEE